MKTYWTIAFCSLAWVGSALAAPEKDGSWLCKEESSQRRGNQIFSCGIGKGSDEASARLAAFDNAKKEFNKICDTSSDCSDHAVSVHPQRTSCNPTPKGFECYRLIAFEINDSKKAPPKKDAEREDKWEDVRVIDADENVATICGTGEKKDFQGLATDTCGREPFKKLRTYEHTYTASGKFLFVRSKVLGQQEEREQCIKYQCKEE